MPLQLWNVIKRYFAKYDSCTTANQVRCDASTSQVKWNLMTLLNPKKKKAAWMVTTVTCDQTLNRNVECTQTFGHKVAKTRPRFRREKNAMLSLQVWSTRTTTIRESQCLKVSEKSHVSGMWSSVTRQGFWNQNRKQQPRLSELNERKLNVATMYEACSKMWRVRTNGMHKQ